MNNRFEGMECLNCQRTTWRDNTVTKALQSRKMSEKTHGAYKLELRCIQIILETSEKLRIKIHEIVGYSRRRRGGEGRRKEARGKNSAGV